MTDENLEEIKPLRIVYHPGVVLEVVVENQGQASSSRDIPALVDPTSTQEHPFTTPPTSNITTLTQSTTENMVALTFADIDVKNQPLVIFPGLEEGESSLHATITMQPPDSHFSRLHVAMNENKELHAQVLWMQQEMQRLQRENQEQLLMNQQKMIEGQEKMNQMQEETLNTLTIIQNRVEAVLTQNYELHEYPIPRLFIVLPKVESFRSNVTGLISEHFRLYFLCECGKHTMTENTRTLHEIHMAKHEGYDLVKPTEFFKRFGNYLLAMMYMVKLGIAVAGLTVPPLANLKILEGLDTAQKYTDYLKKNVAPLVDKTIKFLSDTKSDNEAGTELAAYHTEFGRLEALEGADLRQLYSYLKIKDEGRVLGNLYRTVTPKGHVKWVCLDHYRVGYREAGVQELQKIVEDNQGTFIEQEGRIEIEIASGSLAKQFYEAMVRAQGIQELDITLKWDASMDDLRMLAKAVTKTNVAILIINGSSFKSPTLDAVNRNKRFDPILQLATNLRVHSLQLRNFDNFFNRIDSPKYGPVSKLREFSMDSGVPLKDKAIKSFNNFLKHCPSLVTIELKLPGQSLKRLTTPDTLSKLQVLRLITIDCGNISINANISQCKVQDMNATITKLGELESDDLSFIKQGLLTRLTIVGVLRKEDKVRLLEVLRSNLKLCYLHVRRQEDHSLGLTSAAESKLDNDLISLFTSDAASKLQHLESLVVDCPKFSISTNYSKDGDGIQGMTATIERLGDFNADSIRFLQKGHLTQLAIKYISQESERSQLADILRHNPMLSYLKVGCRIERCLSIINTVVSKRETTVQETGLRMEILEEGFIPIDDVDEDWDYRNSIQCTLSFTEGITSFDMRTWIRLRSLTPIADEDPVCDFIRSYGWSVVSLEGQWTFNDHLAAVLDAATSIERSSPIERLSFSQHLLTASGIDSLDNIVNRSRFSGKIGLYLKDLDEEDQLAKGKQLLSQYRGMLNELELFGYSLDQWLPQIASSFLSREYFPTLISIEVGSYTRCRWPSDCVSWIATMAAAPALPLEPSPSSSSQDPDANHERQQPSTLKKFSLKWCILEPEGWKTVIEAIDLSTLQRLSFEGSNFSKTELILLVDRFPDHGSATLPLTSLDLRDTDAADDIGTRPLYERLQKEAPGVKIIGI
ncbi:hypothetical protein BGX31_010680 [Mortierella sp. GBA43]|nr:hypothetical protein BGX31_010680 [Mortierella sp. GBA43]